MAYLLVIDDDEHIRNTFCVIFQNQGHYCLTAKNGKDALRLMSEHHIDLVLTDILMPEKDGLETIMEIRRSYSRVKIIAISGGGIVFAEKYLKMASVLGADRICEKPVPISRLISMVNELIEVDSK